MNIRLRTTLVISLAVIGFVGISQAMQGPLPWKGLDRQARDDFNDIKRIMGDGTLSISQRDSLIRSKLNEDPRLVRVMDSGGNTLLHTAVQKNVNIVAQRLVLLGANPEAANKRGETPLSIALTKNNPALVSILLGEEPAVQPPVPSPPVEPTVKPAVPVGAIQYTEYKDLPGSLKSAFGKAGQAIKVSDRESLSTILNANPGLVGALDSFGNTLLLKAVRTKDGAIVKLLLDRGFDINKTDKHGNTPLSLAVGDNSYDMVNFLMNNGADVNKPNNTKITPLAKAIAGKEGAPTDPRITQLLKDAGGIVYGHAVIKLVPTRLYQIKLNKAAQEYLKEPISQDSAEAMEDPVSKQDMHISLAYVSVPLKDPAGIGHKRLAEDILAQIVNVVRGVNLKQGLKDNLFTWDKMKILKKNVIASYNAPAGYTNVVNDLYRRLQTVGNAVKTYEREQPPHVSVGKLARISKLTEETPLVQRIPQEVQDKRLFAETPKVSASIRYPVTEDPGYKELSQEL